MRDRTSKSASTRNGSKKELVVLLILFIVIVAVALVFYGRSRGTGDKVIVTVDGTEYGTYSLQKDQEVEIRIDGTVTNLLVIKDGYADVIDADCPDKLCVNMKAISKDGESIVCLPNKVLVEIDGTEQAQIDTMVQ